nr:hypothetical protein [Tanacetum cinerariifolium]
MPTQQDIYAVGSESRPPMLNKENYVPWSSRLLRYAKSRLNGKLIHNSILNGPYVRKMIPKPGDANRDITEIWLRVQQMMKGSDIGIQVKKAKLFNEWERFTSNEAESIKSYYHRFLKLMNDLKRNKHFPEKIASNLKFLNNLQPEWSRHVIIVHQTKDLHTADYTQLYDFLKYNQKEVDELKAKRLAKTQDPLALMANSNNPYEAAKFVGDFKSLANEANASLTKHKALELEIEGLLKAVVSHDIMIIVQNESVVDTSDLLTELELMFRINPSKTSKEENQVPNTVRASARTKPITVS